jgi:hypothetical protein
LVGGLFELSGKLKKGRDNIIVFPRWGVIVMHNYCLFVCLFVFFEKNKNEENKNEENNQIVCDIIRDEK